MKPILALRFKARYFVAGVMALCAVIGLVATMEKSSSSNTNRSVKQELLSLIEKGPVTPSFKTSPDSAAQCLEWCQTHAAPWPERSRCAWETGACSRCSECESHDEPAEANGQLSEAAPAAQSRNNPVFVHIPKTGGTAVEGLIGETLKQQLRAGMHGGMILNVGKRCTKKHVPAAWFRAGR
jgi:hypothetical protein